MSSVLYQTFYPYNKFDDVNDISNLNKYMLSKEWLVLINCGNKKNTEKNITPPTMLPLPDTIVSNSAPLGVSNGEVAKSRFIIPNKGDTLFWCVYIYHYGEDTYLAIGSKYGNAEIAEKQKIMEFLKSNKYGLKNVNRRITLGAVQEIMSDLMTNTKTSLQTMVALSVFYKKNILLLNDNNKTYIEYIFDKELPSQEIQPDETKWLVIRYMENKKYGFFIEEMKDVTEYCNKYTRIESYDKPLKGISTYKMSELVSMAINIPEMAKETKITKPDLYGKIWHYCLWV